jgi:hypothetical protein
MRSAISASSPAKLLVTPGLPTALDDGFYAGERKRYDGLEVVLVKCKKGVKMSIQLQIEEAPDYLAAKFTGAGEAEEIWRQFELIAEYCKRANKNKLLFDIKETYKTLSLVDRYRLGDVAEIFVDYKLIKVAVVCRQEQLDPQRFGEMVARNRWVNARVFTSLEDAEKWLMLKPAAPQKRATGHHHSKPSHHAHHTRRTRH